MWHQNGACSSKCAEIEISELMYVSKYISYFGFLFSGCFGFFSDTQKETKRLEKIAKRLEKLLFSRSLFKNVSGSHVTNV